MPSANRPSRRPRLEALEDRAVPSASLLKDINLATASGLPGFADFAVLNGTVYFPADDGVHGLELWKSDGTAAGTALVKDINTTAVSLPPGISPLPSSNPMSLTVVDNLVYFLADDGVHGQQLWKTDGTAAGTAMAKAFPPPPANNGGPIAYPFPRIDNLTAFQGALYFTAPTPDGVGLYRSTGTDAGTTVVRSFQPGTNYGSAFVGKPVAFQGKLFFAASDSGTGIELWASDGTAAGTAMVKDINAAGDSNPSDLTVYNGRLYFAADDGVAGSELWSTDGTAAGTALVKDVNTAAPPGSDLLPRVAGSYPHELTVAGGTLYFAADDGVSGSELWKTDGTAAGTSLVKDIYPGKTDSGPIPYPYRFPNSSSPQQLTAFAGRVFFVADDGKHGLELWTSDGTAAGTRLVKDINPKSYPGPMPLSLPLPAGASPRQLTVAGKKLFFTADDGTHGTELWATDGTTAGTALVKDIQPSAAGSLDFSGSSPEHLIAAGNAVFFSATTRLYGSELWKSDGTAAGTALVKDVNRNTQGSNPRDVTAVGAITFFAAADADHGEELWKTDGTAAGTTLVKDLLPGGDSSAPQNLVNFNGALYFTARDAAGNYQLFRSNGTAAGTALVKGFAAAASDPPGISAYVSNLTVFSGKLYFTVTTGGIADLYRTDGTPAGTVRMYRFPAGSPFGGPPMIGGLTVAGQYLYFVAQQPASGLELWRTDGKDTRLVRDINRGPDGSSPGHLTAAGGKLFFTADDGVHGNELWVTDGTPAGTKLVKDINPGSDSAFFPQYGPLPGPDAFLAVGATVYFAADDGARGRELWKSDGTAAGTALVKDINPAVAPPWPGAVPVPMASNPANLTAYNGAVYFSADDGVHGTEVWKSDGTAKGTVLLADVWAGSSPPVIYPPVPAPGPQDVALIPNSSYPSSFTVYQGLLYFTAADGTHGTALWSTDGTTAGTRMAAQVGPGQAPVGGPYWGPSFGRAVWAANGRLYLVGQDAAHGAELWMYLATEKQ